jgi:hypothetical protein
MAILAHQTKVAAGRQEHIQSDDRISAGALAAYFERRRQDLNQHMLDSFSASLLGSLLRAQLKRIFTTS